MMTHHKVFRRHKGDVGHFNAGVLVDSPHQELVGRLLPAQHCLRAHCSHPVLLMTQKTCCVWDTCKATRSCTCSLSVSVM